MNPDMIAAIVCREYGWTYEQYQNQPAYWIDIIIDMLQAEGEASKQK